MSIPGEHNPYSQPGQPQPDPNNPYAQPAGYGYPQASAGGYGPMTPSQAPSSTGGSRGGLPSWLWAVLGIVVASAVWAAALVVISSGDEEAPQQPTRPQPNLAGYPYNGKMCETADTTAFDADYEPNEGYEPSELASENPARDHSACTFYLRPVGSDLYSFSYLYLTFDAVWHKGSSPRREFAARYRSQEQYEDANFDYRVEPVEGLGDEAFLVYQTATEDNELAWVYLGVRQGWFEYTLTWDAYIDTATDTMLGHLLEEEPVGEAMRQATEATLAALKGGNGGGGGGGEINGDPDA